MWHQETLKIKTTGRGTYHFTSQVQNMVAKSQIQTGLCHLFLQHTSASMILCENADPSVRTDLETFMSCLVKDGDNQFTHTFEGPDDMSAHIRSILTHNDMTIPITQGRLALGTWQGLYLWEHRYQPYQRSVIVTLQGA